jgi:hypothetical protein
MSKICDNENKKDDEDKNDDGNNKDNNNKEVDIISDLISEFNISKKSIQVLPLPQYNRETELIKICKSFENQSIVLYAHFMGNIIEFNDNNIIGNILENIFYPIIKKTITDFEQGPKQLSPDYYANNREFEFEQKAFINKLRHK